MRVKFSGIRTECYFYNFFLPPCWQPRMMPTAALLLFHPRSVCQFGIVRAEQLDQHEHWAAPVGSYTIDALNDTSFLCNAFLFATVDFSRGSVGSNQPERMYSLSNN